MKNYVLKALSNYEGHKYVETQAERIAEGDLAPRIAQQRRDPVTSHTCERCLESKKTSVMVKDGCTIIIGGLIKDQNVRTTTR